MSRRPLGGNPRGFTLLEVMIAVAILATSMVVLVESQTTAVYMTTEAERMIVATMLARERIAEVQVRLENEGFSSGDVEEEGDFADFGVTEGLDIKLDVGDDYADYRYAWTVREVEVSLGGDISSMMGDLEDQGYGQQETTSASGYDPTKVTPDIQDLPGMDNLSEQLNQYIREVRVVVWWGDNSDGENQVELVTHAINPNVTGLGLPF